MRPCARGDARVENVVLFILGIAIAIGSLRTLIATAISPLAFTLVYWLGCASAAALVAWHKRYSGSAWLLLGALFGVFALVKLCRPYDAPNELKPS
jgi:hypothetical protein